MSAAQLSRLGDGRVQLSGVISLATVPGLLREIESLDAGTALSVDLSRVQRADSAGVALLVAWLRNARRAQRDIRFLNMPPQMLNITRVSGLDAILPLERE